MPSANPRQLLDGIPVPFLEWIIRQNHSTTVFVAFRPTLDSSLDPTKPAKAFLCFVLFGGMLELKNFQL